MDEPLISGGAVRKLCVGEAELYRQHLLRLDAESRRNRFGGAVSDEFIRRYSEPSALNGAVIYGFLAFALRERVSSWREGTPRRNRSPNLSAIRTWPHLPGYFATP